MLQRSRFGENLEVQKMFKKVLGDVRKPELAILE